MHQDLNLFLALVVPGKKLIQFIVFIKLTPLCTTACLEITHELAYLHGGLTLAMTGWTINSVFV